LNPEISFTIIAGTTEIRVINPLNAAKAAAKFNNAEYCTKIYVDMLIPAIVSPLALR